MKPIQMMGWPIVSLHFNRKATDLDADEWLHDLSVLLGKEEAVYDDCPGPSRQPVITGVPKGDGALVSPAQKRHGTLLQRGGATGGV